MKTLFLTENVQNICNFTNLDFVNLIYATFIAIVLTTLKLNGYLRMHTLTEFLIVMV